MNTFECQQLAQEYGNWLRQQVKISAVGDVCVITSPFVDRHHDFLQIYVQRTESGLRLSDDGYVIRDLRISGLEIDTERRIEILKQLVRSFGIKLEGDELIAEASERDFAQKKHDLLQTMLAVGELIHLAQPTVVAVFKEDVEKYLGQRRIRFVADVKLTGQSGLNNSFDFVIAASEKKPERYVKAISMPSREHMVELMFSWHDIRPERAANAKAYAMINDQERKPSIDHVRALENYGIEPILWTAREEKVSVFVD